MIYLKIYLAVSTLYECGFILFAAVGIYGLTNKRDVDRRTNLAKTMITIGVAGALYCACSMFFAVAYIGLLASAQ